MPLTRLINISIGIAVAGTLAYLVYRDAWSALVIDISFGCIGMITQLALLDLAAKSCPRHIEATFFALLMSVYNGGTQLSQNVGARLYDSLGYTPLVLISAVFTALAWVLVPLVRIDRIEARAGAEGARRVASAPRQRSAMREGAPARSPRRRQRARARAAVGGWAPWETARRSSETSWR
jgi:hypothetical protein